MSTEKEGTLHSRILGDLEGKILSGAWAPGHRLPFEVDLAAQYGCSRMTVNKVMGQLVRRLQASKGKEAGLQNQLKDLDKGLKDVNRSTEDNSPAAIAQKQQQLQKLQKDVSRLQSSLGYDE